MHILLVESHEDTASATARALVAEGYRVSIAPDSEAVARLCAAGPFDVALVEICLPGVDGYELLRRVIRGCARVSIALTTLSGPRDVAQCIAAGFAAHVAKPVFFIELMATIRGVLAANPSPSLR